MINLSKSSWERKILIFLYECTETSVIEMGMASKTGEDIPEIVSAFDVLAFNSLIEADVFANYHLTTKGRWYAHCLYYKMGLL
jgi:hypothetical protein